ncbi:FAD-binding oxidoreductase [Acuticoccus sp. I52.16.1]|uniref:NAD(P)/FAD-dependent oxidoreductase n=1 Tax=Acuticoccus sp. I52.16.1 TaxID=2928472 RepID=UPI001FD115AD|nr:FAD-binding oxidoreductase [Acuticoccus sp. I52.16.1]UOM34083.1 FAD-binding oxidoreductase [Acuticoccus sp. I52.16.1]
MSAPDVLVIGAGITGAAAALSLAEAGASVEVIDAYGPAAMASGWTLAGVRQSGRHPAELPLAQAAVAEWPHLAAKLGAPTHYRQEGNLRLARDDGEVEIIKRLVADQSAAGLELTFLPTLSDVRTIAPAISDKVIAASFCPSDGHADPVATVTALLAAAERAGARLRYGERVRSLEHEGGRITHAVTATRRIAVGAVVIAGGVHVNDLLAPLGARIPMIVPIVTVVQTEPVAPTLGPVLGVANANLAVRQEANGCFRLTSGRETFDGTLEEENGRPVARPRTKQIATTIARTVEVLPVVGEARFQAFWGGLLDLTPDSLPVIDHVPGMDNAVVAAGFSGHGFCLGPVTGPLAADLALGRAPRFDLAAFRFDRLAKLDANAADLTLHG